MKPTWLIVTILCAVTEGRSGPNRDQFEGSTRPHGSIARLQIRIEKPEPGAVFAKGERIEIKGKVRNMFRLEYSDIHIHMLKKRVNYGESAAKIGPSVGEEWRSFRTTIELPKVPGRYKIQANAISNPMREFGERADEKPLPTISKSVEVEVR